MTRRIWKYDLAITDRQTLHLPRDAELLLVDQQQGRLRLWALVDATADHEPRLFAIYGTGHPLPDNPGLHLGTVVIDPYVWHVFEI